MPEATSERDRIGAHSWLLPSVGAAALAADRLSKAIVVERLGPDAATHRVELIGNLVFFQYAENSGAAFGLFAGQTALVSVFAVLLLAIMIRIYRTAGAPSTPIAVACGLILGGAVGNLIDRARLGYVVDFIGLWRWPKFNLADSAITIGALALAWWLLRNDRPRDRPEPRGARPVSRRQQPGQPS